MTTRGRANLETAFYILAGFCNLGLIVYYLAASHYFRRVEAKPREHPGEARVAVIIPATGEGRYLIPGLRSVLTQDYREFELLVPVESESDPAWSLVLNLAREDKRIRPILAGQARSCGQKNKNLLAALDCLDPGTEVVVFMDAERMAGPGFLGDLIGPVIAGRADLASGYHHFLPNPGNPAGAGKALTVMILGLSRNIPFLSRAWGGATALSRAALERLDLALAWADTVVDDAIMAKKSLADKGIRAVMIRPGLGTPDQGETWASWQDWLTRQIWFFRTILPLDWLLVGALSLVLSTLLLASPVWIAAWALAGGQAGPALAGGLFLFLYFFLTARIRRLHPAPGPLPSWILACSVFLLMVLFCFCRTCLSNRISWRGKVYGVGWGGRVRSVSQRAGEDRRS